MRYRETFIIKHGERLILKGVDPAGKQHHESELGAKDRTLSQPTGETTVATLRGEETIHSRRSAGYGRGGQRRSGQSRAIRPQTDIISRSAAWPLGHELPVQKIRSNGRDLAIAFVLRQTPAPWSRPQAASASTARSGADRIRHRPPAGLARHAVLHRFDRRQGSLPSPAAQQLTAGECRARSVSR
jgi:hypothetical protein